MMSDLTERLIALRDDYFFDHDTRELLAEAANRITELEAATPYGEAEARIKQLERELDDLDPVAIGTRFGRDYRTSVAKRQNAEAARDRYHEALKAAQSREAELRRALVEAIEIAEGCHECVTADCSIEPTLARLKKLADV